MKPLVYIIIVNWNGEKVIIDCLNSLSRLDYDNYKILVVDNNSSDNSVNEINRLFPTVRVLELNKNYGFTEGNNKGFMSILEDNPKYVIFLNNDTEVDPNFIKPLVTALEKNPKTGQTVPKIYYADQRNKIWFAGGKINLWAGQIKHIGIRKNDSDEFNISKETHYATGCCFAMCTTDFNELGGFDPSYPMYCEDVDLSLRMKNKGQIVYFVPDSKVYHKISSSIGGEFAVKKIFRKIKGYIKLFQMHTFLLQKFTIGISWLFAIPYFIIKLAYFRIIRND